MNRSNLAIPGRLNLAIAGVQLVTLLSILWAAGQVHQVEVRFSACHGIRDRHEFRIRDVA